MHALAVLCCAVLCCAVLCCAVLSARCGGVCSDNDRPYWHNSTTGESVWVRPHAPETVQAVVEVVHQPWVAEVPQSTLSALDPDPDPSTIATRTGHDDGHGYRHGDVSVDDADPYSAVALHQVAEAGVQAAKGGVSADSPSSLSTLAGPAPISLQPPPGAADSGAFAVHSSVGVTSPGGTPVSVVHAAQVLQVPRSPVPPSGKPSTRQLFAPTQRRGSDQRAALTLGAGPGGTAGSTGGRRPSTLAHGGALVCVQEEGEGVSLRPPARRRSTMKPTLPPGAIPLPPPLPTAAPGPTSSSLSAIGTPWQVQQAGTSSPSLLFSGSQAPSSTPQGVSSGRRSSVSGGAGRMSRRRSTAASRAMLPARPPGVPHDYPATPTGCMDAYWDGLGRQRPPGAGADVLTALHRHRSTDTQFLTLLVGALAARCR